MQVFLKAAEQQRSLAWEWIARLPIPASCTIYVYLEEEKKQVDGSICADCTVDNTRASL